MADQLYMTMNDGHKIPVVGLGTWKSEPGKATYNAVLDSINAGYRHIDTARAYGNEEDVGSAVKDSGIERKDLFITTKLRNPDQGFEEALQACEKSLERLDCDYKGDDMEIGFNSRFILEMLSNITSEEINLSMSLPNKAGIISPVGNKDKAEDITMLVMPVMLNE